MAFQLTEDEGIDGRNPLSVVRQIDGFGVGLAKNLRYEFSLIILSKFFV